ncbi:TPA: pyruvate kinase [Pasteurella multocida]|uniref:pyruvate kinase n=1 Tax=Pasteurella multocida TaxID=747 RepID=UPI0032F7B1DB|nr:pyruvate kinase [Pasteurella multocida]
MKKFDLEKSLTGEPVVLRNGSKAFIVKHIPEDHIKKEECELIGYLVEGSKFHSCATWTKDGKYNPCFSSHIYDIIGMYEEPRPTVTLTLPSPIKTAHHNQEVFKRGNSTIIRFYFDANRDKHRKILESGSLFYSEEDAQAWLDAMKNARR